MIRLLFTKWGWLPGPGADAPHRVLMDEEGT
jgi:hypothetical protein